ncbi:MAG: LysR family transcriptional regulator [Yoonia sp.]
MDWNDFQLLDAAGRCSSLTELSKELGADPTTVSRHMRKVEDHLGLTLFERTRGRLVLTPQAQHLAQHISPMSSAALRVLREARVFQDAPAGKVAVSAPPTITRHLLAGRIGKLSANFPTITLDLTVERSNVRLDKLEADIAVRLGRPTDIAAEILIQRVGSLPYAVFGLSGNVTDRWICYPQEFSHLPEAAWVEEQLAGHAPILRSNDPDVMAASAADGIGKALLAVPAGAAVAAIEQLGEPVLQKEVYVMRRPSPDTQSAINLVHEWLVDTLTTGLRAW